MIKIKNLTVKNFLSVGNVTQGLKMDQHGLTLVLGNNLDLGGDGSRNGTGKTTIVNALSFALYGSALTNIKKDNLINKTNGKNMLVTCEFESNGHSYKIERGRKPNILRLVVDDLSNTNSSTEEQQGENKETQAEIERIIGMGHDMFKHIMALNTYTEPFLSLKTHEQRDIIEQLLGITQLSEKAVLLKELIKNTKDSIKEEEFRIKAVTDANNKIKNSIQDLERRSRLWQAKQTEDLEHLAASINELLNIDIEQELANHKLLAVWQANEKELRRHNKDLATHQSAIKTLKNNLLKLTGAKTKAEAHQCHACGQDIHDSKQEEMMTEIDTAIASIETDIITEEAALAKITEEINKLGQLGSAPRVRYTNIDDAVNHKSTLETIQDQFERRALDTDPYVEQAEHLKVSALEEINFGDINSLVKLNEHQEFLLKLLTAKDSFVRKRIIEQNLTYLNHRLAYYLEKLALPHTVKFRSDLEVDITQLGQEFDFDNLSRGERNRLILGLSWAFRDVYESLNRPLNLLFIDEMIDSGMDANGVDNALGILKKMAREQKKNIFLISHRDELVGRVNNILQVVKENGFTTFNTDVEMVEA
jgi:DNA repair exonuclease SbcCD ATPase subunit